MNLSQLEVLVAIVDTGSLTEAAEVVSLTQSAVSYSLSRLESELGVSLLERGRQGVQVTQIGEEVLQHARSILTQVEIIRQKTERDRGLAVGKLRFGCVRHVAARLLTGVVRDFQHKYPAIEVVVFEGTSQELLDWLTSGVIDIATVLVPENFTVAVPLVQNEIKVFVSTEHPFAAKQQIQTPMLDGQALIGPKAEYGNLYNLLRRQNKTVPRLHHEVSTFNTILAMVRENMGISIAPEMLIDSEAEGIVKLSLDPPLVINVYLAANVQSPAVQTFLTAAHNWAKSHGYLANDS